MFSSGTYESFVFNRFFLISLHTRNGYYVLYDTYVLERYKLHKHISNAPSVYYCYLAKHVSRFQLNILILKEKHFQRNILLLILIERKRNSANIAKFEDDIFMTVPESLKVKKSSFFILIKEIYIKYFTLGTLNDLARELKKRLSACKSHSYSNLQPCNIGLYPLGSSH